MHRTSLYVAFILSLAPAANAQWPRPAHSRRATEPRRPCEPDLAGAADEPRDTGSVGTLGPRTRPEGKPGGVENTVFPRYLMDITQDLEDPRAFSFRRLNRGAESSWPPMAPQIRSRDVSRRAPPRIFSFTRPTKIIETPGLTLLLH